MIERTMVDCWLPRAPLLLINTVAYQKLATNHIEHGLNINIVGCTGNFDEAKKGVNMTIFNGRTVC